MNKNLKKLDAWESMKQFTNARIALGHVDGSLPLEAVLAFKLAHANAKDAIYTKLNISDLSAKFEKYDLPIFTLKSKVENRNEYLKRPDLGRKLNEASQVKLSENRQSFDLVFVLADGLSAEAVNAHTPALLDLLIPDLKKQNRVAICMVDQGRVAIGDEIGSLLNAKMVLVMIGERPGLSAPKSLGIYTTYAPQIGLTDERRNCISNIHSDGLSYEMASHLLTFLIQESLRKRLSGVELKMNLTALIG